MCARVCELFSCSIRWVASYVDDFMTADFFGGEFRVAVERLACGDNGGLCFDELCFFLMMKLYM